MAGVCVAFGACSLYDDMSNAPWEEGAGDPFSYIDATNYSQWVYLNLRDGTVTPMSYDEEGLPEEWTFALHRYDCKTNGGAALETGFTSLDELRAALVAGSYSVRDKAFVEDTEDSIAIDMSHMMDSLLIYAPSMLNKELGKWLDVDISVMPPIYTPSGRTYIIRTREGEYAAVLFTGFTNPYYYDAKGYISFSCIYPLDL